MPSSGLLNLETGLSGLPHPLASGGRALVENHSIGRKHDCFYSLFFGFMFWLWKHFCSFMRWSVMCGPTKRHKRVSEKQSLSYSKVPEAGGTTPQLRPHEKTPGWSGDRWQKQGEGLGRSLCWGFWMKSRAEQDRLVRIILAGLKL